MLAILADEEQSIRKLTIKYVIAIRKAPKPSRDNIRELKLSPVDQSGNNLRVFITKDGLMMDLPLKEELYDDQLED